MSALLRGCLYWVRLLDESKRRPALVLSPDRRNERATSVVVVPCSTTLRMGPWHVLLRRGEGGLPAPSMLKCENVTTIDKALLDPRPIGGAVTDRRLDEVRAAILRALEFDG